MLLMLAVIAFSGRRLSTMAMIAIVARRARPASIVTTTAARATATVLIGPAPLVIGGRSARVILVLLGRSMLAAPIPLPSARRRGRNAGRLFATGRVDLLQSSLDGRQLALQLALVTSIGGIATSTTVSGGASSGWGGGVAPATVGRRGIQALR